MVKFSEKKEFLDGNIKINFEKLLAIKIIMSFKPVFTKTNTTLIQKEETQSNDSLNIAFLDVNTTDPTADDYNKYIVVSDPVRTKANMETITSLADINNNIEKFQKAANEAKSSLIDPSDFEYIVSTYAQGTNELFVQNMINFLNENQSFWHNVSVVLLDFDKMSGNLRTRIEESD